MAARAAHQKSRSMAYRQYPGRRPLAVGPMSIQKSRLPAIDILSGLCYALLLLGRTFFMPSYVFNAFDSNVNPAYRRAYHYASRSP